MGNGDEQAVTTIDAKQRAAGAGTVVVPLRPCLVVAAVIFLALGMSTKRPDDFVCGYMPLTLIETVSAGLFAMAACFIPPRSWEFPAVFGRAPLLAACLVPAGQAACRFLEPPEAPPEWAHLALWGYGALLAVELALAACIVLARRPPASAAGGFAAALALFLNGEALFYINVNEPFVSEPHGVRYLAAIYAAAAVGLALTASLLTHLGEPAVRRRWLFRAQVVLLFASGAVLRFASEAGSPDPIIDVWHAQQNAADHILAGEDPYAAEYANDGAPFYPPLPFLVGTPFRALGRDTRLGNVACDLIAALALFAAAGRGSNRLVGALLAACYLHFPRVPLIIELAWYEPMLAAALGGGAWLVARGWRLGYFVMGLGITGKQYAVVLLPALWKGLGGRRLALLLGTALAAFVVVLPFYLWDREPFVERVVRWHVRQPVRHEGVTFQAAARDRFHAELPRGAMAAAAALLIGLIAWRAPSRGPSPAPWMAASLIIFCLFFTQAYLNYFYLCVYLLLLGLADLLARDEGARP